MTCLLSIPTCLLPPSFKMASLHLPCKLTSFRRLLPLLLLASLLLCRVTPANAAPPPMFDICKMAEIKNALSGGSRQVIVRTPSSSEDETCKPAFVIPAVMTLDISVVSSNVPKKTFGTEQHCIRFKVRI